MLIMLKKWVAPLIEIRHHAAYNKHWDCLQYAVDNKCPGWEGFAKTYWEHVQ